MKKDLAGLAGTDGTFTISSTLDDKEESTLVTFLRANINVFAWQPSNIPGVPREVIEHHLVVYHMPDHQVESSEANLGAVAAHCRGDQET